ncbi:hypothetical protein [Chondromyces crocatus]|uniref:Uncharacterized protein n=1 Tax=Chondromyces crocatus TaxID=52 RepID=A0A0K1EAM3_CHOCO|nr:hypothetical protein [Chondromyces crocatus]AKT37909.1 uncharacterized protein CMC5_020520 [Chondromyces crocatus]
MAGGPEGLHEMCSALAKKFSGLPDVRRALVPGILALASSFLWSSSAAADDATRPLEAAIQLGSSPCLEARRLAEHIGFWLKKEALDARLAIVVSDTSEGVRFVVRRDGVVIGQRTLEILDAACADLHAAVGLGIASAIDATLLEDLGIGRSDPRGASSGPLLPGGPGAPGATSPMMPGGPGGPGSPPLAGAPWSVQPLGALPPVWGPRSGPGGMGPSFLPGDVPGRGQPSPFSFGITLEGGVLVNVLPSLTYGISPSAELALSRRFELRAGVLVSGTGSAELLGGTATADLIAGRLDFCAAGRPKPLLRLRACAGMLAGAVNARGGTVPDPRTAVSPWISPAVRVDGTWWLMRPLGLLVSVDGFFPGLRPELQILDPAGGVVAARRFPLAGIGVNLGPALAF